MNEYTPALYISTEWMLNFTCISENNSIGGIYCQIFVSHFIVNTSAMKMLGNPIFFRTNRNCDVRNIKPFAILHLITNHKLFLDMNANLSHRNTSVTVWCVNEYKYRNSYRGNITGLTHTDSIVLIPASINNCHDDLIKWKHFLRYWSFVRGIRRSPVNSHCKGQWHGALMFSLICAWANGWVSNRDAGNLRRHRANYDVTVII